MGLLKSQAATPATAAAPSAPAPKAEEPKPPSAPAGAIPAKDGKPEESYKFGDRVGKLEAIAGKRVFFVTPEGAPFTCTTDDMIVPVKASAPATPAAPAGFGSLAFSDLKPGSFYVLDAKGLIGEFTGVVSGLGYFCVGEAITKLPAGAKVDACKVEPDNKVLPKDAPKSEPAVAAVTKGGDDAEDDDEPEEGEATPTEAAIAAQAKPDAPAKGKGRTKKDTAQLPPSKTEVEFVGGQLFLIVNGTPTKGTDLAPYVADMAKAFADREKLVDIRCAPKDSALAYDGWKGLMRAAAIKSPPSGVCFIYDSALAAPVIEALASIAAVVVRF